METSSLPTGLDTVYQQQEKDYIEDNQMNEWCGGIGKRKKKWIQTHLRLNLYGDRTPDGSVAAHPRQFSVLVWESIGLTNPQ